MSTTSSVEPIRPLASLAVSTTSDSPYVGPRPFLPSDCRRFFGRDREAIDLKHRVMAHPITLLYSMSGAGKTSLINARLVPDLVAEGCHILPSARVRGSTGRLLPGEIPNIYAFHVLMSWQEGCDLQTPRRSSARPSRLSCCPGQSSRKTTTHSYRGLRPVRRTLHSLFQSMERPSGILRTTLRRPGGNLESPGIARDARRLPCFAGPLREPGAGELAVEVSARATPP